MSVATENSDFELVGQLAVDLQRLCEGREMSPENSPSPLRSPAHSEVSTNDQLMAASPPPPSPHTSVASPSSPVTVPTTVDITVPEGAVAGQQLAVKLVDGRDVEVVIIILSLFILMKT